MDLPFTRAEYDARVEKTKARMAAAGIDVLLATDPANMNYLTGYDGWSFYVHQLVIVAQGGTTPVWIGRAQDANGAKLTTYLAEADIVGYPDTYIQSTERHPMSFVADALKQRGWAKGTIGVEMDAYYYTAACQAALSAALPGVRLADATSLVNWVRVVKSEAELGYMREAARIMDRVMTTAIEQVEPGRRQCDAAAEITRVGIAGTAEFGGDYASIVPLLPTGVGSSAPHMTWSDKPFRDGEGTIIEFGAARHRYHCPLARTVHLGKPPRVMADTARVVVDGLTAALEAAKPGALAQDIEAAWAAAIAKSGVIKDSRIGYSIGLNYPPDWGEHTISLRPGDRTVLEENMTLHCIPGIWLDDWGIDISEALRVTETGGEPFCSIERKLFVKD